MTPNELESRWSAIHETVRNICEQCGRRNDEITILAVSKLISTQVVDIAYSLGIRQFGENRVEHFIGRQELSFFKDCSWHMIGHVQTRKVNRIVGDFSLIHSVDTLKLAYAINQVACQKQVCQPVLLQVNASGEERKQGFTTDSSLYGRDNLFSAMEELAELPGIEIQGLMTMAPNTEKRDIIRSVFQQVRIARGELQRRYPKLVLRHLSMGMSNDFDLALQEGATIIRIGSRLFA
jgi:pyridoxal phosphate enzyme (YggS family)